MFRHHQALVVSQRSTGTIVVTGEALVLPVALHTYRVEEYTMRFIIIIIIIIIITRDTSMQSTARQQSALT
jgi:hypothetical protein